MIQENADHKLTLTQRNRLTMTGVSEVVSFDDTAVVLRTNLGTLIVQGNDLQLKTLSVDGGQMEVNGSICAMTYEEPKNEGGWLSRLFR